MTSPFSPDGAAILDSHVKLHAETGRATEREVPGSLTLYKHSAQPGLLQSSWMTGKYSTPVSATIMWGFQPLADKPDRK